MPRSFPFAPPFGCPVPVIARTEEAEGGGDWFPRVLFRKGLANGAGASLGSFNS